MSFLDDDWRSVIGPKPFHRPDNSIFYRISNRLLPPPPPDHVELKYGDLKEHFRAWHYLLGIPMLAVFLSITTLEFSLWRGFSYSPLTVVGMVVGWIWGQLSWYSILLLIPVFFLDYAWQRRSKKPKRHSVSITGIGVLSSLAVYEEQWFREGAENWTTKQRFLCCLSFGLAHMANWFYPISTILPLSLLGYLFLRVYLHSFERMGSRRDAIMASALVHRVYNRIALIFLGAVLLYFVLQGLLPLPSLGL